MGKWIKLGHVFGPAGEKDWMHSHAANPTAEALGGGVFRIYFSARDKENRSSIGTLELDIRRPQTLLSLNPEPVLRPGERGAFDDSGLSMGCLVENNGVRYLYYLGWNLGVTVPFRNSVGLAVSREGGPFERVSRAPVLDRSEVDPFCLSYPWVLKESGNWHMWYGSHLEWTHEFGGMRHVIKYATSEDGVRWKCGNETAIGLEDGDWGVSRPCVLREGSLFRMWFSRRKDQYRLGYAESIDGIRWQRKDSEMKLEPSPNGWDSESVSYPFVFRHEQDLYLLYCGNGYGRTGFGLAQWEEGK